MRRFQARHLNYCPHNRLNGCNPTKESYVQPNGDHSSSIVEEK